MNSSRVVGRQPLEILYFSKYGSFTWSVVFLLDIVKFLIPIVIVMNMYGPKFKMVEEVHQNLPQVKYNDQLLINVDYMVNGSKVQESQVTHFEGKRNLSLIPKLECNTNKSQVAPFQAMANVQQNLCDFSNSVQQIDLVIHITSVTPDIKAKRKVTIIVPISFQLNDDNIEGLATFEYSINSSTSSILNGYSLTLLPLESKSRWLTQTRFEQYLDRLSVKFQTSCPMIILRNLYKARGVIMKTQEYFLQEEIDNSKLDIQLKLAIPPLNNLFKIEHDYFNAWKDLVCLFIPSWIIFSFLQWILIKYEILSTSKVTNYTRNLSSSHDLFY